MSINNIKVFENSEFGSVRTVLINDEPWFVGKEIATILGYADTKSALSDHVDIEDKQIIQRGQITSFEIPNRGMVFINESGLYSLIISSKMPKAKEFKRWVTSEVLPSIRKTGKYEVQPDGYAMSPLLQQLVNMEKEQYRQRAQLEGLDNKVTTLIDTYTSPLLENIDSWRKGCASTVYKLAQKREIEVKDQYNEIFEMVDRRAGVSLKTRLENKKKRAKEQGLTSAQISKINNIDVIAEDKKLREIYKTIIKELSVKYM